MTKQTVCTLCLGVMGSISLAVWAQDAQSAADQAVPAGAAASPGGRGPAGGNPLADGHAHGDPRVCHNREIPGELRREAANRALQENPENRLIFVPASATAPSGGDGGGAGLGRMMAIKPMGLPLNERPFAAIVVQKKWKNGRTLNVYLKSAFSVQAAPTLPFGSSARNATRAG